MIYAAALLALGMLAIPMAAADEHGPEHPDNDHDGDDSAPAAPAAAPAVAPAPPPAPAPAPPPAPAPVATPSDSSFSRASGATSTFDQTIDIPPDNVIAALALGNSGFGFGRIGLEDISNIHRSASSSAFANQNVALNENDVLLSLALGNRGLGLGFSPFLGTGLSTFGTGFSTIGTCSAHDRLLALELGLRSSLLC